MTTEARRLAGADLVLEVPRSLAERWDVAILYSHPGAETRACAAALGLCWRRFRARKPYPGNALQYGGTVVDTLLGEGASMGEILAAAAEAYALCVTGLVSVEGAADFSAPPDAQAGPPSGG
jgi:hypothetical protein